MKRRKEGGCSHIVDHFSVAEKALHALARLREVGRRRADRSGQTKADCCFRVTIRPRAVDGGATQLSH